MQRAAEAITEEGRKRITQSVVEAESHTSAEIVPVIATDSGRYDRAEDVVGLWLGIVLLILTWSLLPATNPDVGTWGGWSPAWEILALSSVLVAGFIAGALLAMRVGWLRRLFAPRQQMRDEVARRAREAFFDRRVHHTAGASGVLVFVSLFERMAAIMADESVLNAIGQPQVDAWCNTLTAALQVTPVESAIAETVRSIGADLKGPLPRATDDVNELSDAVILLN